MKTSHWVAIALVILVAAVNFLSGFKADLLALNVNLPHAVNVASAIALAFCESLARAIQAATGNTPTTNPTIPPIS